MTSIHTPLSQNPLVSIIVLNYNGKPFLETCFRSLLETSYQPVELLMVDNASSDDSVNYVKSAFPMVTVIQSGKNAGYSRGNNIGITAARGKYVVLLNNDVRVTPGWISPLVDTAERNPMIAGLQPKILSMIDEGYFEYAGAAGGMIDPYGYPFLRGRIFDTIEKDSGQYEDTINLFWASGAALFLRMDALKTSGLLDEDFVHHMEEIDLCWRLLLQGYQLQAVPSGYIFHYAGATIKPDSYKKMYWNHRNSIFMLIKNYQLKSLIPRLFIRYLLEGLTVLTALVKLDFKRIGAVIQSSFWLITHIPMLCRKRRAVQKCRKVSDTIIDSLIYPRSIVIQYFLKKRKTFSELMRNNKRS